MNDDFRHCMYCQSCWAFTNSIDDGLTGRIEMFDENRPSGYLRGPLPMPVLKPGPMMRKRSHRGLYIAISAQVLYRDKKEKMQ